MADDLSTTGQVIERLVGGKSPVARPLNRLAIEARARCAELGL
jgi:hypothetical protein